MKSRISKVLLAASLAIGLVACHGQDSNEGSGTGTGASSPDSPGSGGSGSGGSGSPDPGSPDPGSGGSGGSGSPSPGPDTPPSPGGPGSETLINQALAKGEINAETALIYRVLAAFGDARLPALYKGNDGGTLESNAIDDVIEQFDSLSSTTQDILAPFLLRPSAIGSWADPSSSPAAIPSKASVARVAPVSKAASLNPPRPTCRGTYEGWTTVNSDKAKVSVWYRFGVDGELDKARVVSDAMEREIWPKLIGMGFKEPADDFIVANVIEKGKCWGGDSRLDVYLVPQLQDLAQAVPEGFDPNQGPVFILVNSSKFSVSKNEEIKKLKGAIAHEFMHAIQQSYKMKSPQKSYGWMRDAMANWAIDQVYEKEIQFEHGWADCFTSTPELSLDDRSAGNCKKQPSHVERDYGAYLFFQFIARTAGADKVKLALENTQSIATSLEAVDAAIPGGFKDQWWKFAKTLWNQAPIDTQPNSFKQWDQLQETPAQLDIDANLNGAMELKYDQFERDQKNLSSRYYHFTFSDPNTRSILFYNGFFDQIKAGKAIKILALWNDAAGNWQEEDWTPDKNEYKFVGLCRDLKSQRATELTIIVANGEKEKDGKVTASKAPYLKRNNVGCYKYEGQVTMLEKEKGWGGLGFKKAVLDLALGFFDPAVLLSSNGTNPLIPNSLRAGMNMVMNNIGTSYSFEVNYTSGLCTYTYGPVTRSLAWGTAHVAGMLNLNSFKELGETREAVWIFNFPSRGYLSELMDNNLISLNVAGPGCVSPQFEVPGLLFSSGNDPEKAPVVMPDGSMQGSFADGGFAWTWNLTPKSEP